MNFSNEQKVNAYKNLPEEVKDFVASEDFTKLFQDIGRKYQLLIDKSGILGDTVLLSVLGLTKTDEIADELEKNLGISREKINLIVDEINQKVFIPIRKMVMEEGNSEKIISQNESERDKVLSEIENPVPTKPTTSLMEAPEKELVNKTATDNFIAKKMSPDVSPSQNTGTAPAPKRYSVDPYREPLS